MSHVRHFNRVLRAAEKRALTLEEQMVAILVPLLEEAGRYAARSFERLATDHMVASAALRRADRDRFAQLGVAASRDLLASLSLTSAGALDGVTSASTMICVKPRPDEAAAIADPDGAPPESLHVTLAYLGEVDGDIASVADALRAVAAAHAPLSGVVGGYGEFRPPGCGILLPDVPGLVELRVAVTEALVAADIGYGRDHGYLPHMTVDGSPEDGEIDVMLERAAGMPLHFDDLLVVRGDSEVVAVPLVGVPALTAAARRKPFCLPAELRGRTDPVRRAAVVAVARDTVEGAGISFDVTNPHIAEALETAGSQIIAISQTTQSDVMKAVSASYEEGFSIPDTAKAIQQAMIEAAPARARLIARTELAGAVNSGSLAAVRMVGQSTGTTYYKQWMTAGGAKFPRHEDYDGLDGQTVQLGETFDVGGDQLDHPGDPNGSPEEVCNCRCALGYTEDASELSASAAPLAAEEPSGLGRDEALAIAASMTAAGVAGWSSPAPEEILPIGCAETVTKTGAALDVALLNAPAPTGPHGSPR